MSLKPGLAHGWFEMYNSDVYPNDYVVLRGKKMRPPKYYDGLLLTAFLDKRVSFEYDEIMEARQEKAKLNIDDNTPERLLIKEAVKTAQIRTLVRNLD